MCPERTVLYIFLTPMNYFHKTQVWIRQELGHKSISSALFPSARMLALPCLNTALIRCTQGIGDPERSLVVFGGITLPAPMIPMCFMGPLLHRMNPQWIIIIGLPFFLAASLWKYFTHFFISPIYPLKIIAQCLPQNGFFKINVWRLNICLWKEPSSFT